MSATLFRRARLFTCWDASNLSKSWDALSHTLTCQPISLRGPAELTDLRALSICKLMADLTNCGPGFGSKGRTSCERSVCMETTRRLMSTWATLASTQPKSLLRTWTWFSLTTLPAIRLWRRCWIPMALSLIAIECDCAPSGLCVPWSFSERKLKSNGSMIAPLRGDS